MSEPVDRCRVAALRILQYRFNGEAELRRKLARKKFDKGEIEATIAKLREENWLDDARFAGAFVRTRAARKLGPERIRRELIAAGVDRETAEAALRENSDPERDRDALAAAYAARRRALESRHGAGYASTGEGRAKIAAWLMRQGFEGGAVRTIVRLDD